MFRKLSSAVSGDLRKRIVIGAAGISLLAAVLACSSPFDLVEQTSTPSEGSAGVATLTATPVPVTSTPTSTPISTSTPAPTSTPPPTVIPAPTDTPIPPTSAPPAPVVIVETAPPPVIVYQPAPPPVVVEPPVCGYDSTLFSDVTIPDGTDILAGSGFTKTWRIKNDGCLGWPADDTSLVFVSGNQMSGPDSVSLSHVRPGDKQDVSVNLVAPDRPGSYVGRWQLEAPNGSLFGQVFTVRINVVGALVTFSASYAGPWTCSIGKTTRYEYGVAVSNTSTLNLESASWTLFSGGRQVSSGRSNTPFQTAQSASACGDPGLSGSTLAPGASGWISAFVNNKALPAGKAASIVLRVCSDDNLRGTCASMTINFAS